MAWKSESNSTEKDYFKTKENILLADKIYCNVKLTILTIITIGDKKDLLIEETIHRKDLILLN